MTELLHRAAALAGITPEQARAVVLALADPTPEMIEVGMDASLAAQARDEGFEKRIWQAMLDRAVNPARPDQQPIPRH